MFCGLEAIMITFSQLFFNSVGDFVIEYLINNYKKIYFELYNSEQVFYAFLKY